MVERLIAAFSLMKWDEDGAVHRLSGGLSYLVGAILVTIAFNVPRNNALAGVYAASDHDATLWASYVTSCTAWNHVQTAAASVAAALLTIALVA